MTETTEVADPDRVGPGHRLITDAGDLEELIDEIAEAPAYAVDTEFHRERTYFARLALIQLGWPEGVALVDPLAVDVLPLGRLFAGPGLAVLHAADQDLEVLERSCGTAPTRLYDTQVCAGFIGFSSASLVHLVEKLLDRRLQKGDQLADWTRRPLSATQLEYAAGDVLHLLELRAVIDARLEALDRIEWAAEECQRMLDRDRSPMPLDEAWWRIRHARQLRGRSRGVAQCVAAWREVRARSHDLPGRYVLSDLPLMAIAQKPPRSRIELEEVRGLDRRQLGNAVGEELMAAIDEGWQLPEEALHLPPVEHLEHVVKPAVSIATAWVAHRAGELEIDPAILGSRSEVVAFLQHREGSRLASGWRHDLLGEPLRRLTTGTAAVAFDGHEGLLLEERSGVPLDLPGHATR